MSELAPQFPLASGAVTPLRTKAETAGLDGFSLLWSGQAAALARDVPAGELTCQLGISALTILSRLASSSGSPST
jgi:nitronate monooxygenase